MVRMINILDWWSSEGVAASVTDLSDLEWIADLVRDHPVGGHRIMSLPAGHRFNGKQVFVIWSGEIEASDEQLAELISVDNAADTVDLGD